MAKVFYYIGLILTLLLLLVILAGFISIAVGHAPFTS